MPSTLFTTGATTFIAEYHTPRMTALFYYAPCAEKGQILTLKVSQECWSARLYL